jgi:DNA polymerase-3 subunit delta
VLVVRQCERWRASDLEAIKTYCANPASSTVLILFSQDEKITTAAWREISGLVYHVECYPLFDNQIPAWIEHRAREYGKSIERLAVQRLMERVGQNLSELDNELAKCAEYVGPAMTIPEEAVREVTGIIRADTLREFNVALGKKDAAAAMQCANRLLAEGIKPPQILGALVYHIRQLLKHVMALEAGEDPESFLAHLRNPQARKELQLQIRNFALRDFDVIFRDLLQLDEWSKNGKPHWELYFQLFVLKLCGQPPLPSKTIAAGKRAR